MSTTLTELKRTFYYDGELLVLADFIRDQMYVRDLVRYQNYYLFDPGVLGGLTLDGLNTTTLKLSTGAAIDGNGVPLFIVAEAQLSSLVQGDYYATLAYNDTKHTSSDASLKSSHTIAETPQLALGTKSPDPPKVVLGKVTVDAAAKISAIDMGPTSGREQAALKLAAATSPMLPRMLETIEALNGRVAELEQRLAQLTAQLGGPEGSTP